MNIGIIVYSHTGHTLSVAEKLQQTLAAQGHQAQVERVLTVQKEPSQADKGGFASAPDTDPYDMLIFASPVWAFGLSAVMRIYLEQIPSLQGKPVGLFVTQSFPYAFLGGTRAVRQMEELCLAKGGRVVKTGIVSWSKRLREARTDRLLRDFKTIG